MAISRLNPYFGYQRVTIALKREGIHVNHKRVYEEAPLRKLVTDITYIRVGDRFVYLSAIQDLFNNEQQAHEAWNTRHSF